MLIAKEEINDNSIQVSKNFTQNVWCNVYRMYKPLMSI